MAVINIRGFMAGRRGTIVIMTALMLPLLVGAAAAGVGLAHVSHTRHSLQEVADAAAVAAARELRFLSGLEAPDIPAALDAAVDTVVRLNLGQDETGLGSSADLIDEDTVEASLWRDVPVPLGALVGRATVRAEARAVAQVFGGQDVCLVALEEADAFALDLNNDSRISGPGCAVQSNSSHRRGLELSENSSIEADHICSAGGARGMSSAYRPRPTTDCPRLQDPFAHRLGPGGAAERATTGPCLTTSAKVFGGSDNVTLLPGRYCHDIEIGGTVTANLIDGLYVFENAVLYVKEQASLNGADVALVFTGHGSSFAFHDQALINLHGRVDGDMAGLLMLAEPRTDGTMREFRIMSSQVRELVGTIYLPGDYLNVLTDSPVAADSAFTVVMARRLKLHGNANLVLNRDYATSTVPKFPGLRDYGGGLRLIE